MKCPRSKPRWRMLLRGLSSHFDSYNYCHKIIKVSFGKYDVGRCILSQSKGLGPKNFPGGFAPRPLHLSAPHIICPHHAAEKYSRNSSNCALLVSVSSKGPASTSCPGARPRSRRPCTGQMSPSHTPRFLSRSPSLTSLLSTPLALVLLLRIADPAITGSNVLTD